MNWFHTYGCRSGHNCGPCRSSRKFRESIVSAGMATEPEFACPFSEDPPSALDGPGTRLMRILKRMGFKHHPRCPCADMVLKMNLWGKKVCYQNSDIITETMRISARDPLSNPLGIPFVPFLAKKLVLHCCK